MNQRYLRAFTRLMDLEGGGVMHKVTGDPGGRTVWGIAENRHPRMFQGAPPDLPAAVRFYWEEFWVPLDLEQVRHDEVAFQLFEFAANAGPTASILAMQRSANEVNDIKMFGNVRSLETDGMMGPLTLNAVNAISTQYSQALVRFANRQQLLYYERLPEALRRRFLLGWTKRT